MATSNFAPVKFGLPLIVGGMSDDEIEAYVSTPEPYDKAGSYAVQGKACVYIKGLNGDYFNVVGLPVSRLYNELSGFVNN